ncbi:MAG: nucleoside-binding protein [Gammaproteobacteria bacterium]|nr:nucleoside-binding protein [Gammaproteobacteria bacterium]
MSKSFLLLCSLIFFASPLTAKTIWSDFSLTYLKGSSYEVGDTDREVLTFEHANGTTWGGSFLFFDRLESANGDNETYGEFSARIRVKELSGFVKSIYVVPSLEMGAFDGVSGFSNSFTNYLYGVGIDLDVPHFQFFQLNGFYRNNQTGENNYQATLVWGVPIGPLFYDGFLDWTTSTDDSESSMNFTSQLKYDIAPHIGLDSKLFVGIEYAFWNNKFGIDGVDERNANLLVKYHF